MADNNSYAIILIPTSAVSRAISPDEYNHGLWIRWPVATNTSGDNRIQSLLSRFAWRIDDPSTTFEDQKRLGIELCRDSFAGQHPYAVIATKDSPDATLLGGPNIQRFDPSVLEQKAMLPDRLIYMYFASDWQDAQKVVKRVSGKSIIIAYPPDRGSTLSAAWLGSDTNVPIPASTRVPGLVPASEVVRLLTYNFRYPTRPAGDVTAQQWMQTINSTRPVQMISLFCFTLLIVFWALKSLSTESGGRLARLGIAMVPCAFVALFLAGNFAKTTGLAPWNILPFFAYFALFLSLLPVYLAVRSLWPQSHPLFPVAILAAIMLLWAEPLYTVFSNVFTPVPLPIAPLALGGVVAALTASVSLCLAGGIWPRLFAAIVLCVAMLVGVFTHQWWAPGPMFWIIPIIALVCGVGAMRVYLLPLLMVWPFLFDSWNGHLAWDVNWLLNKESDIGAINAAAQVQFLLSPEFLISIVVFVLAALLGGDFLKHQLKRSFAASNNARGMFWGALAIACLGLREPYLLPSALVVLISGFLILLFDAAGTL